MLAEQYALFMVVSLANQYINSYITYISYLGHSIAHLHLILCCIIAVLYFYMRGVNAQTCLSLICNRWCQINVF